MRRLRQAKIKPFRSESKLKLFELTPEVEELLAESGDPRFDDVKLEDAQISKEIKRAKLDKIIGRSVDPDEVLDKLIQIFKGLRQRIVFTYPAQAGPRLHKLKTGREITAALKRDFTSIFSEFREDFRSFLK
jgi:hypothetical protein